MSAVPNPFEGMKVRLAGEEDSTPAADEKDKPASSSNVEVGGQSDE